MDAVSVLALKHGMRAVTVHLIAVVAAVGVTVASPRRKDAPPPRRTSRLVTSAGELSLRTRAA